MPIYEYACSRCGSEFEALVRTDSTPNCPSCHSTELTKKLSVFNAAGAAPVAADPCASCGHPDGPGACALH